LFHFLSKKPFLKELIPDNHVDIHSHLLPGIDDGSPNIEETKALVSALRGMGVTQFVTTPHVMKSVWDNTTTNIQSTLKTTTAYFENNGNAFPLRAAAEYLMDNNFVQLFGSEPLLTLKDNYVLVEMSYINPPIQLYEIIFELQVAGYQPVLAHPERYKFYHHSFKDYEKLHNSGCRFQLNLLSCVGYYGSDVAVAAEKLLKKGLIDFVGSDVHHQNHIAGFSKRMLFQPQSELKQAIANNQFFGF
jgi:protein-tyrosine phosphatase